MNRMVVYGIRHGEAWHNVLFNALGKAAYTNYEDSTLTVRGMTQAVKGRGQVVPDIVYVSPLTRTLQTATLMFPETPIIAVECLKEYPQHVQIINRRSTKSKLEVLFPTVDFSQILMEEDRLFNSGPPLETLQIQHIVARQLLKESPPQTIVFVTHSSWLKYFMYGDVGDEHDELEHCIPYEITLK